MAGPLMEADGRRKAAAARRRQRESQIIKATRELFDSRGVNEVRIEHVAEAVGVNRAIVYRHFAGKDDLFALTQVDYLAELLERMTEAAESFDDPQQQLAAVVRTFVDYGLEYPAFVDCAQALMRRSGPELLEEISEHALFHLGRAISGCLNVVRQTLESGVEAGVFTVREEPTLLANMLYAHGLGALQLARVGILVQEAAPGIPTVEEISHEQVREYLVASTLALLRSS